MAVHIKNNWMMLPKKPESIGLDMGSGDKSMVTSANPKANIEVNVNDLNLATQEKIGFGKVAPFPGMEFILDDLLKFLIMSHGGELHIYKEKLYHIQKHYSYNHPMDQVREALLDGSFDHLMYAIEGRHNPFYLTIAPVFVESLFSEGAYKFTMDTSELEPKSLEMTTMYGESTIVKSGPIHVDWALLGGPKHGEKIQVDNRRDNLAVHVLPGIDYQEAAALVSKTQVVIYRRVDFMVHGKSYCFGVVEEGDLKMLSTEEVIRYITEVGLQPCN